MNAALAASTQRVHELLAAQRAVHADARCVETHISWVLLAGDEAWKIKKPLKFDFLDFATAPRRRAACEDELRVNRRTAPQIYLDVVPVTGGADGPEFGGRGPVLDWAVHMRRFPAEAELLRMIARGALHAGHIDALARQVAALHTQAARATEHGPFGHPEGIEKLALENFAPLARTLARVPEGQDVAWLARWCAVEAKRLASAMRARLAGGWVRECHGDLHLGNLLWLDGEAVLFDAIEFDAQLRWIDVMADVAFPFMDLRARSLGPLAWRFLNAWLDHTGDHAGLALLPFYASYRALVRAKVAALRAAVPGDAQANEAARHVRLARELAQPRERALWLASGVSGSGKSSQGQPLIERLGLVALHSDIERKRLFGLAPLASSAGVVGGIYTSEASARTYAELHARARTVLDAGLPVLVDATFLRGTQRAAFIQLARELHVPCRILAFDAPGEVLRERLRRRAAAGGDASEATVEVLARQLAEREPFTQAECALVIRVDTTEPVDWARVLPGATIGQ